MHVEESLHAICVVGVERSNVVAPQPPVVDAPRAYHLARMFAAEIVEGVVADDASDAGDEHGKKTVVRRVNHGGWN